MPRIRFFLPIPIAVCCLIALVSLCPSGTATAAQAGDADAALRLPLPADAAQLKELWYGIYLKNDKIGYARIRMGKDLPARVEGVDTGGESLFGVDMDLSLSVRSMGRDVMIETNERLRFATTPPYRFVAGSARRSDGTRLSVQRTGTGKAGAYEARMHTSGGEDAMTLPHLDASFLDFTTPQVWFERGPAPGDKLVINTFTLSELKTGIEEFTLRKKQSSVVNGVNTDYYVCRHASTATGMRNVRVIMDSHGTMLLSVIGKNLEMRKESEQLARKLDKPRDLFVMGFTRINRPIGKPDRLESLQLKVRGSSAAMLESGPRQTVRHTPGGARLDLGAPFANTVRATDAEVRDALAENPEYPLSNARVAALARKAVRGAASDGDKVRTLLAFVHDFLKKELRPGPVPPVTLLDDPRGDCTEHADLFTLLARAAGIPARPVSGLYYMGDKARSFGGHAWCEVVLDGVWREVDPVMNQFEPDPAHVRLEAGPRSGTGFLEHLGELHFTVLKAIPKPTSEAGRRTRVAQRRSPDAPMRGLGLPVIRFF